MSDHHHQSPSLAHLSVGAFAMVMGIGGLAAAWNKAAASWGPVPTLVGAAFAWLALAVLAALLLAYAIKLARFPRAVAAEWRHPVRSAFTAAIPVSMLVTSVALLDHAAPLSAALWWAGVSLMAIVTVSIVRTWIVDAQIESVHVHPAWFIPVVGNMVVPIAGVSHGPEAVSWAFFGVGLIYWLGLLPIVLRRLFVEGTMPARLTPTLAILVAPPAVASISWVKLGGSWTDPIATVFLALTMFQVVVLTTLIDKLRKVPFALPSWAYTFPLAAAAVALIAAQSAGAGGLYGWFGGAVLGVATALVLFLAALTARGFANGHLLQPE